MSSVPGSDWSSSIPAVQPAPIGDVPGLQRPWEVSAPTTQPVGTSLESDSRSQRGMREIITVWLLGLLCLVVALAFTALFMDVEVAAMDKRYEHLKSLLDVLLGPIVTLLSSVIGFYFGSQSAQQRSSTGDAAKGGPR